MNLTRKIRKILPNNMPIRLSGVIREGCRPCGVTPSSVESSIGGRRLLLDLKSQCYF